MRWRALVAFFAGAAAVHAADWHSIRVGHVTVVSDEPVKELREATAALDQLRFSSGKLLELDNPDVHPGFELILTRSLPAVRETLRSRTGAFVAIAPGWPSQEAMRAFATELEHQNVAGLPAGIESGLETFLALTQVTGAHVVWGAAPAPAERTEDWALVDWLVTNPETYGKMRVLFHNLGNGAAPAVAFQNSVGLTPQQARAKARAFLEAGRFPTIDAPSEALSVARDLVVHGVGPEELSLIQADLLQDGAQERYLALLHAGKFQVECQEGLALLAARRGDEAEASQRLQEALQSGSKNAYALTEYARLAHGADVEKALGAALEADPSSADAHYLLANQLTEPDKRIEQLQLATKLAPRTERYWIALAQALEANQRWTAAAQAWDGAVRAATTDDGRERAMQARLAIENHRLDLEAEEKRKAEEARDAEINRLKAAELARVRAAEEKTKDPSAPDPYKNAVAWDDLDPGSRPVVKAERATGTLVRASCAAGTIRLTLRTDGGATLRLAGQVAARGAARGFPGGCSLKAGTKLSVEYAGSTLMKAAVQP